MSSKKLNWSRYVQKLKSQSTELDLLDDITTEIASDFQEYYEEYCRKRNIDLNDLNNKNQDKIGEAYGTNKPVDENEDVGARQEEEMTEEEKELFNSFSKLFKKIALRLHPDRIDKNLPIEKQEEMINTFQKANKAMEERKYFLLLDIAESLNLELPKNYSLQIKWMKKQISETENQIQGKLRTYNYKFSEAETDEEKDILIEQFMRQLFGFQLNND